MKAYWRKWSINIFRWRQSLWWLIFCWEWDWKSKNNIPRAQRHAQGKSYTSIFNFRYGMNNSIYNRLESLIFICQFIIVGYCTGRRQKLVRIFNLSAAIKNIHLTALEITFETWPVIMITELEIRPVKTKFSRSNFDLKSSAVNLN